MAANGFRCRFVASAIVSAYDRPGGCFVERGLFLPTGHDQTRLDVHTSAVRHRLAGLSMATLLEMMIGAISGGAT